MTRIKVAVRVRPLSTKEIEAGSTSIIAVENGNTVAVTNTKVPEQNAGDSRERIRRFTFDYCLEEDSTQDHIFEKIENVIGQSIKRRFHSCVLAYGQSASGKTHTMMGFPHDPGLTPKLCHRVFGYLQETAVGDEVLNLKVSVSYLEIYNEKVRDLLRFDDAEVNGNAKKSLPLKVREHPKKGPYVQGLSEHPVTNAADLLKCLDRGNKQRRVAATSTNPQSSRSHSVFSISCDGVKLHLIDLAGSERAGNRCYSTPQFREGANINKSLVALGNVISALAEQTYKQKIIRRKFVPYRDSVLTWLLKDTLGGNSNTVMVATVSPSNTCYSETVNTLRFGQRAKLIISHPVVNEDPKEKTIRELRVEIDRLRDLLKLSQFPQQITAMAENSETTTNDLSTEKQNICEYSNTSPSPIPESDEKTDAFKEVQVSKLGFVEGNAYNEINVNNISNVNTNNSPIDRISEEFVKDLTISKSTYTTHNSANSENLRPMESMIPDSKSKTTTEKLLPLINVSSSLKPTHTTKLRRTYSVDHTYRTQKNTSKMFGSEESIPSSSNISRKSSNFSSPRQKSHGPNKQSNSSSSVPIVNRRSLNPSLPKPITKTPLMENIPKKIEKGVVTEPLTTKAVEAKVNSLRKTNLNPRSHIVAAVTSRLYSKIKMKEAATDTDDINTYNNELPKPKELSICSNARARLRELTKKALRAQRQKHEETQTDLLPVLRLKETSTDVDDLRLTLTEVKNVQTESDKIETKNVAVECTFLKQFSDEDKKTNGISFTRTCGTQSSNEMLDNYHGHAINENENVLPPSSSKGSNLVSFTKYLSEGHSAVCSAIPTNRPIYTNNVNINISHNYVNGNRINEDISEDSAYGRSENVCFPTPDIISNHNSLEYQTYENIECFSIFKDKTKNSQKINFGSVEMLKDYFTSVDCTIPSNENKIYTVANSSIVPKCTEYVQSINISKVRAPEVCVTKDLAYVSCRPLPAFEPVLAKPKVIEYKDVQCDCVKLEEPLVLKSIVRQCHNNIDNEFSPSEEEVAFKSEPADSLEYHFANNKKVKFSERIHQPENQRMVKAMSEFLEEATKLINNMTTAANNINSNNSIVRDCYELEVTLNDISEFKKSISKKRRKCGNQQEKDSTQRFSVGKADCSTQCKIDCNTSVNKYEALVEESCRRLEDKINIIPIAQPKINIGIDNCYRDVVTDTFSDLGYNAWNLNHPSNDIDIEDSSLESNPVTFSDYGSLPRKTHKRHRTPTCSPSAFLRQLTNMRRQIIESSREGLLRSSNNN